MASLSRVCAVVLLALVSGRVGATSTTQGCTCSTSCNYDYGYGYSWCKTTNSCGQWYSGWFDSYSWDQCSYTWQNICSGSCNSPSNTCSDGSTAGTCSGSSQCADASSNTGPSSYCSGSSGGSGPYTCTYASPQNCYTPSGYAWGQNVDCYVSERGCETASSNCGASVFYPQCVTAVATNGVNPCSSVSSKWYCPVDVPQAPASPPPPPPPHSPPPTPPPA